MHTLDNNNKKGIRILKTINDVRGVKKFKPLEKGDNPDIQENSPRDSNKISPRNTGFSSFASSHGPDASTFDFEEFDVANAKALYRKLNY